MRFDNFAELFSHIGMGPASRRAIDVTKFAQYEMIVLGNHNFDMQIPCNCWWGSIYYAKFGRHLCPELYHHSRDMDEIIAELGTSRICADAIWCSDPVTFWDCAVTDNPFEAVKRIRMLIEIFHGPQNWIIFDQRTAPLFRTGALPTLEEVKRQALHGAKYYEREQLNNQCCAPAPVLSGDRHSWNHINCRSIIRRVPEHIGIDIIE